MQFVCLDCPANMKGDSTGLNCICDDSSVVQSGVCTKCADGQAPNQEGTECLSCGGTFEEGQCICPDNKILEQ